MHFPPYDKRPFVQISGNPRDCSLGWLEILAALDAHRDARRIVIECYPGVSLEHLRQHLIAALGAECVLDADDAMLPPTAVEAKFASCLGSDPVFGRMEPRALLEFFDERKLAHAAAQALAVSGRVAAIGTGATLLLPDCDLLLYVDVARWEIQRRQRLGSLANLGLRNAGVPAAQLYKRAYFLDWRVADAHKNALRSSVDYWIDGNVPEAPVMLSGERLREALSSVSQRPFRVVPFFDPGPWGGQWMRRHFNLPDGPKNYAWGFDCVPEENSLVLRFGTREYELPALTLVHWEAQNLLGASIVERFGAEFPIRFDFLDTMEGGNLSLQVHPLSSYIQEHFGMPYTQDESYYMLETGSDATVFLGLREGIDPACMAADLRAAQEGGAAFPAEKYVQVWPARTHDHFSIPAGTIHCSGRDAVVLEISATPYIFTFKLWDWGRLGLDGRPRPIHLDHGLKNIQWDRTTSWVREQLVDQTESVSMGHGWREERTGLHSLELIETRRHWFTEPVDHDTRGNLNVLNLVEGEAAVVESPTGTFPPLTIHYAETFIVPAATGAYRIRPANPAQKALATIKAYIREGSDANKS